MHRLGFLGGKRDNASSQSLNALEEPQSLRDAMDAAEHIFNDDIEAAEAALDKNNSPFHKLGRGLVAFLRATLGFEPEIMREAAEKLAIAETAASEHRRRAHREGYHSPIYPVGSEYALCDAEIQLMTAVVAVLNESLTESIKGFYRLRKAYATLQEIAAAEKKYLDNHRSNSSLAAGSRTSVASFTSVSQKSNDSRPKSTQVSAPGSAPPSRPTSTVVRPRAAPVANDDDDDDDLDFVDADEAHVEGATTAFYEGHLDTQRLSSAMNDLQVKDRPSYQQESPAIATPSEGAMGEDTETSQLFTNPIDLFIHSGTNLCFGILQLVLSLIPPAFSKLLSIVGFRGDRDLGIQMLWRATMVDNINGAMAGLVTLAYYNTMVGACDILTVDAYPKQRCRELLGQMRAKYPQSRLWLLEESRMLAGDGRPEEAIRLLTDPSPSPLKQVEALRCFERSLNSLFLHRYQDCADGFIRCVDLNNWSHALYLFIAGCCHVELYRIAKAELSAHDNNDDPSPARLEAEKHARRATEILQQVPGRTKKKGILGRQLPFDAFVTRKINKWNARASASQPTQISTTDTTFIDAIGVSPVEEMIYFWNGYKRMRSTHLEHSLRRLEAHTDARLNPRWASDPPDERAIAHVLSAAVTSRLGMTPEAREILETNVLPALDHGNGNGGGGGGSGGTSGDHGLSKGGFRDDWTLPVACYEMAVCAWVEAGGERGVERRRREEREGEMMNGEVEGRLKECAGWIERVARWESFDLDARIGLKVRTAQDTLRKIGVGA